jgi:hypothetical protein
LKAHNNVKGFAFIVTLFLIALSSLLLLASMQQLLLYQRATAQQELQHQRFYQLETLIRQLEAKIPEGIKTQCIRKQDLANHAIEQLMNHQGCTLDLDGEHYRYLVEDLGMYSCLVVEDQGSARSSLHFRISLLLESTEAHSAVSIQIRSIKPARELACEGTPHQITRGISSWRYLQSTITG